MWAIPALRIDPSVGIDAATFFRPHPGQVDRGALAEVEASGNWSTSMAVRPGLSESQSLILIRERLHHESEADFDHGARAEERDREDDHGRARRSCWARGRVSTSPMFPWGSTSSTFVNLRHLAVRVIAQPRAATVPVISGRALRRARSPRSGWGR